MNWNRNFNWNKDRFYSNSRKNFSNSKFYSYGGNNQFLNDKSHKLGKQIACFKCGKQSIQQDCAGM